VSLFAGVTGAPWGIYLGVIPVVVTENVVAFDFGQQFDISDYPIEDGQFASYNKVYRPFDVTFRFSAGGDLLKRQALLDSIRAFVEDTNEYSVVTPDAVYLSVNLVGYRYRQSNNDGVGLIKVDVMARQVKNAVAAVFTGSLSSPRNPSFASQINDGVSQAIGATQAQLSALPKILGF
jgi:hypothetical protein